MEYNFDVLSRQYAIVAFFVQHFAYYRALQAVYSNITDHRDFWRSTCDAHLELATVAWCKVFGTYSEEMHWTKTPCGDTVQQVQQEFRRRILSKTRLTQEQWKAYHADVVDFRNRLVAHHNDFNEPVPFFDSAFQVAHAYQEWVKWLIKSGADKSTPVIWDEIAFISRYEQWHAEALSTASQQRN